jgi:hypothetical protein
MALLDIQAMVTQRDSKGMCGHHGDGHGGGHGGGSELSVALCNSTASVLAC